MCFVHDYGWVAEYEEVEEGPAPGPVRCDECHGLVRAGEWRRHLHLREWEECRTCYEGECGCRTPADDPDDDVCCRCDEPEYGEGYDYDRCEACDKLLRAVEAVERDAGCVGDETRPALCELRDAVWWADDADAYLDRARAMFPDLAFSGHLDRLIGPPDPYGNGLWDGRDMEPVEVYGGEG